MRRGWTAVRSADLGQDRRVHRFYDVQTGGPLRLELLSHDGSRFRVLRQFGYRDPRHAEPFVVPASTATFLTDLTSVPWFFLWLVPRIGPHLPAAVLHDALVSDDPSEVSYIGPAVPRVEADRIFRGAMLDAGAGQVRAWLVWTAVTLATAWQTLSPAWLWRARVAGLFGTVVVLGTLATADLLDVANVLPWMGMRPWWAELWLGAAAAVAIPAVLALAWGRLWAAAAIAGVALALLLHVTLAVVAVYGVYALVERLLRIRAARRRHHTAGLGGRTQPPVS
jgi:Protein of unknown function (DUF1353)